MRKDVLLKKVWIYRNLFERFFFFIHLSFFFIVVVNSLIVDWLLFLPVFVEFVTHLKKQNNSISSLRKFPITSFF